MPSADSERRTRWSQGQILTPEAALTFHLVTEEELASRFPLVITHDCDLAAALDKEPSAEILIGRPIDKLGSATNAKVARRLELALQSETGSRAVELLAPDKRTMLKEALFEYAPRKDLWLAPSDRRILQRWLAARYRRAAFPEAFEDRLRTKIGRRTAVEHIESILDDGAEWIRCLLFELDDGEVCERNGPDDIYRLGITVLYVSASDEPKAYVAACAAAEALEKIFAQAFERQGGARQYIDLRYCDPISDSVLTIQDREKLSEWRLEHLSLASDPPQPMVSE
jgi:hypothetical protein